MNKNKIFIACLCLLIAFGILFKLRHHLKGIVMKVSAAADLGRYNAQAPVLPQDGAKIFTASSLDRIFQDGKTLVKPDFSRKAELSLAKNEYGSFQLVIQTQGSDLNHVELKVSDLRGNDGLKIDSANISWKIVGYVQSIKPYYSVKYVGLWPDPLMPGHPVYIQNHITQPFWVTIYIPPETPAGDYSGDITVLANNDVLAKIPVSVHVYTFTLPQGDDLKTAFDFYPYLTKKAYPQGYNEPDDAYQARIDGLNDQFILMMLQYRMDPILNVDPTSQTELSRVDRYLSHGLDNFAIGKRGGTFDNNWPRSDEGIEKLLPLYETYGEDLNLNQMLQYTYIYTWDEGDIGNPWVPEVASMIHRAYPGLKNMVCYHGIWDPDVLPHWGDDIDIWCFNIDNFDEAKMRRLQKRGMEMWMYVSGPADIGTPNLVMDYDSIDYRILAWMCWKYDIKGFLYWCVNWWPLVDPFENAKNTKWEENGNGLLFYPGKDGPIPSIRAEIFREGMQDYEYIQILFDDLKAMKQNGLDKKYPRYFHDSIKLLTMDNSLISSPTHFTKDNRVLEGRRNDIADKIEEFNDRSF